MVAGRLHRDKMIPENSYTVAQLERAFERRFNLAEHVVVNGAQLENACCISIWCAKFEEKKPRKISIASGSPKTIEGKAA